MEFLTNNATAIALITGIAMAGITEICKRYGLNQKYVITILAVIVGLTYAYFKLYVDPGLQSQIINFAGLALGFATVAYNLFSIPAKKEPLKA